ncbi:RING-H2 finger protein ATL80-like [Primulina eburnea]|uniref:RING-H2 finger protein ATL80-like n=1 Tax=Primulina eburnea TaxID=1245227 RepID=UPI003C6C90F1
MTARSSLLGGVNSPPPSSQDTSPSSDSLNTDFMLIFSAFLCALICVLSGLVAVARCSWIRRISGGASTAAASAPPVRATANKGLKQKAPKALPKHTYGEDKEQAEKLSDCAICLAEFANGEEIRVLPQCGHGFHVACIDMWLGSHSSCPSCRQILFSARFHK